MKRTGRLRIARQAATLSQDVFANKIGVTRGAVSNWERPHGSVPTMDHLDSIAVLTGASFEWLATGRGQMHRSIQPDVVPAVDADWVDDADERRLLAGFRNAPGRVRRQLLDIVSAWATG